MRIGPPAALGRLIAAEIGDGACLQIGIGGIPDAVVKRMAGAEKPAQEGRQICIDLIQEIQEIKGISGVHVMAYRQEETVAEIIQKSGVLKGRVPWYPGRDTPYASPELSKETT